MCYILDYASGFCPASASASAPSTSLKPLHGMISYCTSVYCLFSQFEKLSQDS